MDVRRLDRPQAPRFSAIRMLTRAEEKQAKPIGRAFAKANGDTVGLTVLNKLSKNPSFVATGEDAKTFYQWKLRLDRTSFNEPAPARFRWSVPRTNIGKLFLSFQSASNLVLAFKHFMAKGDTGTGRELAVGKARLNDLSMVTTWGLNGGRVVADKGRDLSRLALDKFAKGTDEQRTRFQFLISKPNPSTAG